jgi:DNA-binding transcriptional MerR regulator
MGQDDTNSKRRQKYSEDPEYRERVRSGNSRYREQVRSRARVEKLHAIRVARSSAAWKTVEIEIDGVLTRVFTVGALAKAVGKSVSTIRMWERNGSLPPTPYKTAQGERLYTLEMVESVRNALRRSGKLKKDLLKPPTNPPFVVRKVRFGGSEPIEMRLYKVGTLAQAANRTVVALCLMEKRGVLPRTPLKASDLKYRLYTLEMIDVVQEAFHKRGGKVRGREDWLGFYEDVVRGWTRLGVMDARIEDEDDSDSGDRGADQR